MSKNTYSVIVGNIGDLDCRSKKEAVKTFREYVKQSKSNVGRAANEPVTLMINGEPDSKHDYQPPEQA